MRPRLFLVDAIQPPLQPISAPKSLNNEIPYLMPIIASGDAAFSRLPLATTGEITQLPRNIDATMAARSSLHEPLPML